MSAVGGAVCRERVAFVQRAIITLDNLLHVVAVAKRAECKRECEPALVDDLAVIPMQALQLLGEHNRTALNAMRGEGPLCRASDLSFGIGRITWLHPGSIRMEGGSSAPKPE